MVQLNDWKHSNIRLGVPQTGILIPSLVTSHNSIPISLSFLNFKMFESIKSLMLLGGLKIQKIGKL